MRLHCMASGYNCHVHSDVIPRRILHINITVNIHLIFRHDAVSLANKTRISCRFYGFIATGTFTMQKASGVFMPGVVVASRPGVIVFRSREPPPPLPLSEG